MAGKPPPIGPNFNNPTAGLKVPKPKPAPKRPAPKKGPYSKPRPTPKFGTQVRVPGPVPHTEVTVKHGKGKVVVEGTNVKADTASMVQAQSQRARVSKNLASVNYDPKTGKPYKSHGDSTNIVSSSRSFNNPNSGPSVAKTLKPVGVATRAVAGNLPDYTLGPDLTASLEGKPHSGLGLGIDIASLLPVFRGPARVVDVAEHIAQGLHAGEDVGHVLEGARTVARNGKNPANRVLVTATRTYENPASRGRVLRAIQRTMDKAAQKSIIRNPEIQGRVVAPYVQHFVGTARAYENTSERVAGGFLKYYKLSKPERVALEAVVHEVPLEQVIKNKHDLLAEAVAGKEGTHSADAKRLTDEIGLLEKARPLLKDIPAGAATGALRGNLAAHVIKPVFSEQANPKLHQALEDLVTASSMRETMAKDPALKKVLGWQPLNEETAAARKSAPGRFHLGARWQSEHGPLAENPDPNTLVRVNGKYTAQFVKMAPSKDGEPQAVIRILRRGTNKQPLTTVPFSSLEEKLPGKLVGHEDFNGGLAYIPSVSANKKFMQKEASFGGKMIPRNITGGSEFKHPYTGTNEQAGLTVHHPTELVAGAFADMHRMNAAAREFDALREGGFSEHEITTGLKHGRPKLAKPGIGARGFVPVRIAKQALSPEAHIALEDMRNPAKMDELLHGLLTHTIEANPEEVKFVPKALVGDLFKAPASQSEALKYMKDVSTLVKNFLVYTKFPGHIPPRLASNSTMAAIQQGASLVPTTLATIKLSHESPQAARILDAAMGTKHTFTSFAQEAGHKFSSKVSDTLARPVIWAADKGPRRVALTYEINQQAGRTMSTKEMADWIVSHYSAAPGMDAAKEWRMVVQRARRAAGEYGRSNSLERKIAPIAFLYQWGKVSVNITAKSLLEHPVRTGAILGTVGKYAFHPGNKPGKQFGVDVPGGRFSNLTTSIPFSTPYEYGSDLKSLEQTLVQGHKPTFGVGLGELVNPAIVTGAELGLGYDPTTGATASGLGALEALGKQSPIGALVAGKQSIPDRIGKFLFGNEYPQHVAPVAGGSVPSGPPLKLNGHQLKLIHRASLHLSPGRKLILKRKLKQLQVGH